MREYVERMVRIRLEECLTADESDKAAMEAREQAINHIIAVIEWAILREQDNIVDEKADEILWK